MGQVFSLGADIAGMSRSRRLLMFLILVVMAATTTTAAAGTATSTTVLLGPATVLTRATPTPGAVSVRVAGNHLVNGAGRAVRLLGVNRAGTEYACAQGWGIFDGPHDATATTAIAAWGATAVRVPLNEDCWLGINGVSTTTGGAAYQAAITTYVQQLHAAGLAVILDLHWNAPGTQLASSQQDMADADHSPAFWTSVATTFRTDPGVVFDLYNEPHSISWSCWLNGCTTSAGWATAGMQTLLNAVRATGATQPVLAGGLAWSNDLSQWLANRPNDPANQLGASTHIYSFNQCNNATCWDTTVAPVAAVVPVVTTELGSNDCAPGFITSFMDWADAHGVGYDGWSWNTYNCSSGPALISSFTGTPTAMGVALQSRLLALKATPPTTTTAPPPTTTGT